MQENVYTIFPLNQDHFFTEEESYRLVDLFIAITKKAKKEITGYKSQLEHLSSYPEEAGPLQDKLNLAIQRWSDKVKRLGGIPLALYKVKIPSETGYFIWEFPSIELEFHFNH